MKLSETIPSNNNNNNNNNSIQFFIIYVPNQQQCWKIATLITSIRTLLIIRSYPLRGSGGLYESEMSKIAYFL
jgi:hypothetical protein